MGWDKVLYVVAKRDRPLVLFISSDHALIAEQGMYGGFVVKLTDDLRKKFQLDSVDREKLVEHVGNVLNQYIPFFIDKTKQKFVGEELTEEEKELIEQTFKDLPKELKEKFTQKSYTRENYTITEVKISVQKVTDRYVIINAEPKKNGRKGTAKMIKIDKRIRYERAKNFVERLRLKYPENDALKNQLTWDGELIVFRIITEKNLPTLPVVATVQNKGTSKTPVLINGFLVISRLPSKALLNSTLPEIFKDTKIGKKQIRLTMGYFYNKLGTLSRKFYNQILREYAIDAGFAYIIPKDNVTKFLEEVEMLKEEYKEYEKQLKEFLLEGKVPKDIDKRAKVDEEYLNIVMEFLKRHGKEEETRKKIEKLDILDRVKINLLPFSVDVSILEEYVDEKVKQRLEKELYEVRKEMVENARRQLADKIKILTKKIEKLATETVTKKKLENIKNEIESIEKTARDLGIKFKELDVLKELVETPIEEIGTKVIRVRASGRLKALLDSL